MIGQLSTSALQDLTIKLRERYPRAMRGAIRLGAVQELGRTAMTLIIVFDDGRERRISFETPQDIHDELQKIEVNLRPREAWEFHKR